ncbi:MAG: cation-transporting P-type ATPase [Micromonosporaceae bacterium]|nr:cation-transporting P-type ATPase [Micromonosporaceae bacterium]
MTVPAARAESTVPAVTDSSTGTTGLTSAEAAARLQRDGPNVVARLRPSSPARRLVRQLVDPLVLLLLAALVVTLLVGDLTDAVIIAVVVVANSAIGVAQEVRAERAIAELDALAAPTARVVREGRDQTVPTAQVVRGDLVRLEAGSIVPADVRLLSAHRFQVDESALTGESVPVARGVGDEASAGTVVVAGRATGVVVRTGPDSCLGRIAALVASARPGPTPLQRRLTVLGRWLGAAVVVLSTVVFGLGLLAGRPPLDMAITAVSLVVAAVPESLPAVVTVALALAARRMARLRAIPRRLHAVETLGSVTVVASDKTGTLTENRMTVQRAFDATGTAHVVTGRGYEPNGSVRRLARRRGAQPDPAGPAPGGLDPVVPVSGGLDRAVPTSGGLDRAVPTSGGLSPAWPASGGPSPAWPASDGPSDSLRAMAEAAVLCSDASLDPPTDDRSEWQAMGDPVEAALLAFAGRCGVPVDATRARWPRRAEQPFDAATRRMTTLHQRADGTWLLVCKGAPEVILRTPLVASVPPWAGAAAASLAAAGLRVLAIAAAQYPAGRRPSVEAPAGLDLLGLVGIGDPVRRQAADTARAFADAGIRLLLVTGDHPATASAIATEVGIWRPGDAVHHGDDGTPDDERVDRARVFARIAPEQKLDIVTALQRRGHVVAMTGDGVNDAAALRRADIGVAMGSGTEVARQAADLVLLDDNLATMAAAVREGRRIYDNIRRFLHYGLSGGAAELLVMLVGPFLGLAIPLLPAQILWINLLTHGVPGVALGAEPADPDVMRRPPRPPQESVLGGGLVRAIASTGALLALAVLGVGVLADRAGWSWQTMVFLVLGLGQLGVAWAVRAPTVPGGDRNRSLPAAVLLSAGLMLAAVTVPPLRDGLGTETLPLTHLMVCVGAATVPAALLLVRRRRRPGRTARSADSIQP